MKAIIYLLCLTSFGFFIITNNTADIHINNGSEVIIKGKSNVNRFTCEYKSTISQGCNKITYNVFDNTYLLQDASLTLTTNSFDCGGRMINKDFNKLMQTDEHPNILIKLKHIKALNNTFNVTADIHIAGKKNTYTFEMYHKKDQKYTGALSLNIEDFDMEAPNKLLGAIKVHPEIDINFDLNIAFSHTK
jgi:hypothetical protein